MVEMEVVMVSSEARMALGSPDQASQRPSPLETKHTSSAGTYGYTRAPSMDPRGARGGSAGFLLLLPLPPQRK